jgi:beta-N-acetylhexosaminidase
VREGPHVRRRLVALGVVLGFAGLVLLAAQAPQRGGDGHTPEPRGTLLDALAGVLAAEGSAGESAEQAEERRRVGLPIPLERAAAQVLFVGFEGTDTETAFLRRLPARDFGAVLVDAANLDPDVFGPREQLRQLLRAIRDVARGAGHLAPLVVAFQQGGEAVAVPGIGPLAQEELGARGSPARARSSAARAGRSLRRLGVHAVMAPVADLKVIGGPADGRAFGDDPEQVTPFVRAAVAGWRDARIAPIVGRFPGEGSASQDPLDGPATVGLSTGELLARDARPFAAVVAEAPAIEVSSALFLGWDGATPATLLADPIDLLRERLGFRGVVISGDLVAATAATGESVGEAAVQALLAGCDLLQVPGGRAEQEEAFRAILSAVRRGVVPKERLAEAVRRVLALKRRYGARA